MLRTWKCEGPACSRWNWPCRKRCHRCGTDRPDLPQRREDWWLESLLPPWAGDEALPPPRDAAPPGPGGDERRVPGLAQPVEGAGAGNSRSAVGGQHRAGGGDARRAAPAVPRPPAARHDGERGVDDGCDGDGRPWTLVAKKKRKKSAAPKQDAAAADGDLAAEATAAEEEHRGRASQAAPLPRDLPPMRLLDLPLLPRQTLVRQHQAAAERVERMQEKGAKPARIQRAVEARQKLEQNVRAAGGHTAQSLSFSIKGEDDKIEKAERALEKAKEDRAARVDLIARQTALLEEDDALIGRLDQRLQAARTRREHLSRQKWAESVSDDTISHIRAVASALAPTDPAHGLVQRLLELMAPTAEIDMAAGDTESEGGSREGEAAAVEEVGGSGSDATRPEEGGRDGADEIRSMDEVALEQAEAAYALLQAQQRAAMAAAAAPAGVKGKRALDADAPKDQHGGEDQEMVRPLTLDQVAAHFKSRLQHCEEELDYRRRRVAEQRASMDADVEMGTGRAVARRGRSSEAAPRRHSGRAVAAESSSDGSTSSSAGGTPRRARAAGRGSASGSGTTGSARASSASPPRRAASDGGDKRGTFGRGHGHDQDYGVCSAAELQQRVRDRRQVLAQERMQAQQERELEQVQRAAIRDLRVRQAAAEVGLRLQAPMPAAPTYGPTGRSLEMQQQLMLQAQRLREHATAQVDVADRAAVGAEGPRRRTRWQPEDPGDDGRHARSSSRSLRPAAR